MEGRKIRFLQEYHDLCARIQKLEEMLDKIRNNTLEFTPYCPVELLKIQYSVMYQYKIILKRRAKYEKIDLEVNADA